MSDLARCRSLRWALARRPGLAWTLGPVRFARGPEVPFSKAGLSVHPRHASKAEGGARVAGRVRAGSRLRSTRDSALGLDAVPARLASPHAGRRGGCCEFPNTQHAQAFRSLVRDRLRDRPASGARQSAPCRPKLGRMPTASGIACASILNRYRATAAETRVGGGPRPWNHHPLLPPPARGSGFRRKLEPDRPLRPHLAQNVQVQKPPCLATTP